MQYLEYHLYFLIYALFFMKLLLGNSVNIWMSLNSLHLFHGYYPKTTVEAYYYFHSHSQGFRTASTDQ